MMERCVWFPFAHTYLKKSEVDICLKGKNKNNQKFLKSPSHDTKDNAYKNIIIIIIRIKFLLNDGAFAQWFKLISQSINKLTLKKKKKWRKTKHNRQDEEKSFKTFSIF